MKGKRQKANIKRQKDESISSSTSAKSPLFPFDICLLPFAFLLFLISCPVFAQNPREQAILAVQDLMQQNRGAEARQSLAAACKKFPGDAGLENLLGILEAQEGNRAAAEAAFKRAILRSPGLVGAYLNLGRLYLESAATDPRAPDKALDVYHRALRQQPANPEANYQAAVLLQHRGEYRLALAHLQRLPTEYRQSAQSLAILCGVHAGLGNREQAKATAEALAAHPDFSEADLAGILPALEKAQREDLAVLLLESLASRGAIGNDLLHRLGLFYERQGQLDRARATIEKAAGPQPSTALLVDLARIAHRQRDNQSALGYLAHARDLEPNNAAVHYFFGMVCVDLALGAEAQVSLGKAVSLDPGNAQYNYAMGVVSSFRHDPAEAIPFLKKFLTLKPDDFQGTLMLGIVYFKSKDYEAAARELARAKSNRQTAATATYYLGSIARLNGRLEEAVRLEQEALAIDPNHVDALAELGQALLQQKQYEQAEKQLQKALAINPDHYAANFNLLTLYSRTRDPRQEALAKRFEEIKKLREERAQEFLRGVEVRPYAVP
jgi:tetratricopeptide (TPR) repeat protein